MGLFSGHKGKTHIQVASRYKESQVLTITRSSGEPANLRPLVSMEASRQLELFS
jgi:hypothetical protein